MAKAQSESVRKVSKHRNARVRKIEREVWKRERNIRFRRAVNYASAAKATRTALEVTQREVAEYLDCSVQAIVNRENGFHSWREGSKELIDYQKVCARIAGVS